ncbi:MAG TPA: hypothetical protein VII58_02045 [Acidobacteriaceae bacterium]
MVRIAALFAVAVCTVPPAFGQASQSDSQTLQAILAELRSMHNDVRLGQTTQILLTELEVQENAVTRAAQRRDDLRNRLTQVQSNEKNMAQQMTQNEDQVSKIIDSIQLKRLTDIQNQLKASMVAQAQQEKDWSNDLLDAENALRKEQDTLQSIQDQLASVIRKLQPAAN